MERYESSVVVSFDSARRSNSFHTASAPSALTEASVLRNDTNEPSLQTLSSDPRLAVHKLDVLMSAQINRISSLNWAVWGFCTLYVTVAVVLSNTTFLRHKAVRWRNVIIVVRDALTSPVFYGVELCMSILACLGIIVVTIVYSVRILRNNKCPVTQPQVWCLTMLICNALASNPLLLVWQMNDHILNPNKKWSFQYIWFPKLMKYTFLFNSLGATVSNIFYLLATADSYGKLEPMDSRKDYLRFYVPKLVPLVLYQFVRVFARINGKIIMSPIPFACLTGMLANSSATGLWFRNVVVVVIILTGFEVLFLIQIVVAVRRTWATLNDCDYFKTRSRQIGFRFYLWNNVVYYVIICILDCVVTTAVPRYSALEFFFNEPHAQLFFNHRWGSACFFILVFFNQLNTAHALLPSDASGILGWFKASTPDDKDNLLKIAPLSISTVIPLSNEDEAPTLTKTVGETGWYNLAPHFSTLFMQSHLELFGFTWLAYEWGRKGIDDFTGWLDKEEFKFHEHVNVELNDTHLLIFSSDDRIVIAFKGTTSTANLKTDAKISRVALSNTIPTIRNSAHEMFEAHEWKFAKLHSGFSEVYVTVGRKVVDWVEKLRRENSRPVLVTGHSLGGALATICSLDLRASLGLSDTNVLVSSFGSPRVGNLAWRSLYDKYVPIHWRFTVENDGIPMLPKVGYKHIGKRVLLMESGNIFLDPSSLEGVKWAFQTPTMANHRKPAYLKCLTLFCSRFTAYEPTFWGRKMARQEQVDQFLDELAGLRGLQRKRTSLISSAKSFITQRKSNR